MDYSWEKKLKRNYTPPYLKGFDLGVEEELEIVWFNCNG
jgi:hypothetical protein